VFLNLQALGRRTICLLARPTVQSGMADTSARPQKITFGEMRESGVREILVYCADHHCSHSIAISADQWPDHVRLSDLKHGSCAKPAARERPISGRCLIGNG
jgi:hypothetical protein